MTHPFELAVAAGQAWAKQKQAVAEKKASCPHHRRRVDQDQRVVRCVDCGDYRTDQQLALMRERDLFLPSRRL